MRVTDNMKFLAISRANESVSQRLATASRRASAGMTVLAPSDNPNVYAASLRQGAKLASWETGARVAREAADELQIGERALDSAGSILEEAASLAVQGSNETLSTTDRSALAARVSVLREELVNLANTRGATGYLFGGTRTDTPPFDAAGTFQGNDGAVYVPVSEGVSPRGNLSGARAFTAAGGRDVFADLSALSTALASGNLAGIRGSIDVLGAARAQTTNMQVEAGLAIERFHSSADVLDESILAVSATRSRALGADDTARILTELSSASEAYEKSLAVTKKLLSLPSLTS